MNGTRRVAQHRWNGQHVRTFGLHTDYWCPFPQPIPCSMVLSESHRNDFHSHGSGSITEQFKCGRGKGRRNFHALHVEFVLYFLRLAFSLGQQEFMGNQSPMYSGSCGFIYRLHNERQHYVRRVPFTRVYCVGPLVQVAQGPLDVGNFM